MNRLFLPLTGVALFLAVCFFGYYQHSRAEEALERASRAEAKVAAHERAAEALNQHLQRVAKERDDWAKVARELEELQGVEDELNPYLRELLDRLR